MTLDFNTNLADPDLIPRCGGPPHALFAAWRERDPVHWNPPSETYQPPQPTRSLKKGFWVLTRYQDVFDISRNQDLFSSFTGGPIIWDENEEGLTQQRAGMMGMEQAKHVQIKRLVMPPFAPKALDGFEPEIEKVAIEIVDAVARRGACEFVFDVASRLPVYTFCKLMGIPASDRDLIFKLGNAAADVDNEAAYEGDPVGQLIGYALKLAEDKRASPDTSMMSMLVHGDVDGDKLPPEELCMFFVLMSIAGHETTRGTAAHFMRLMVEHPDQYALLRSDPDRYLPNAIEEVLRFSPPVIKFRRTATRDTMIGEQAVKAMDKIYLSYPAANRDPTVFPDPDRVDITRDNASRHLSFGTGPHVCLGARLARIQLKHLLKQVVTRIPDFHLADKPEFLRTIWFNAIIKMPLIFTPEA